MMTIGVIAFLGGLAVALVPFRVVWVPVSMDMTTPHWGCGVPARTAVRKVDPRWETYSPGIIESQYTALPSNPIPACRAPARRRAFQGAVLMLGGLLLVTLAVLRARRKRTGEAMAAPTPEAPSNREHEVHASRE
jgi:hypothetical protein